MYVIIKNKRTVHVLVSILNAYTNWYFTGTARVSKSGPWLLAFEKQDPLYDRIKTGTIKCVLKAYDRFTDFSGRQTTLNHFIDMLAEVCLK